MSVGAGVGVGAAERLRTRTAAITAKDGSNAPLKTEAPQMPQPWARALSNFFSAKARISRTFFEIHDVSPLKRSAWSGEPIEGRANQQSRRAKEP